MGGSLVRVRARRTQRMCASLGLVPIFPGVMFVPTSDGLVGAVDRKPCPKRPFVLVEPSAVYQSKRAYEQWAPRWLRTYLSIRWSTDTAFPDDVFAELAAATPDEIERIKAWAGLHGYAPRPGAFPVTYRLDVKSNAAPVGTSVVAPASGSGRWLKV